jgi:class 3 adenylate cyclase
MAIGLFNRYRYVRRTKQIIENEKDRSEKLLLNILPVETAEELKEKGTATPKQYDMVSVLFTDFKGFTNIAEKLTPQELVAELNRCFFEFDKIIDKHGLEKIKTIGDAYMCAGGIPVANTTNPVEIVRAGLEIKQFMEDLKKSREASGQDYWELRIGIHTGPVVAGVVGKNKFAYDIWGDAVNTASRMESSGIPGKVNISGTTFELVKDHFECIHRGKIQAKNKGEIDMYIVEAERGNPQTNP